MAEQSSSFSWRFCFILLVFMFFIITATVSGDSLDTDMEVLLNLKKFLEQENQVNRGRYSKWGNSDSSSSSPCNWDGVSCSIEPSRVTSIDLSNTNISGEIFSNFSALTKLQRLDLSTNTLNGLIPYDLTLCQNLVYLNLSHNILRGELNLSGLNSLEILDLSVNQLQGDIGLSFPDICTKLVVANISSNSLEGIVSNNTFDGCSYLKHLDLSSNNLTGGMWNRFFTLKELSLSENQLGGDFTDFLFEDSCNLEILNLSDNNFVGQIPSSISNCSNLIILNLAKNTFSGPIPYSLGSVTMLEALVLGGNRFSRDLPESLLNLRNLTVLNLSDNEFGGDLPDIFGKFTEVKYLTLGGNSYADGIYSSGILRLQNLLRLDLSYNKLSGPLPVELSQMPNLKFLILAYNRFNGSIPSEFENMINIQALDLSYNSLTGNIPPSLGKLSSLLWLMLANNLLTGNIPPELGNCSSLLWLNLSNNKISGNIPPELMNIGRNATTTFMSNRLTTRGKHILGAGDCVEMMRWIPADYPPFSFVYSILNIKSCRNTWDMLLKGVGIFPICAPGSLVREFQISGYLQLSWNKLSGNLPIEIENLENFSMVHLGFNDIQGKLPREIAKVRLVVLNVTRNNFSGEIPSELGNVKCLRNLDFSYNNFSGTFPTSLNNLTELSELNISYNPLISGTIPTTGQLATFESDSYLGDPLLILPDFIRNSTAPPKGRKSNKMNINWATILMSLTLAIVFLTFVVAAIVGFKFAKTPKTSDGYFLDEIKYSQDKESTSRGSSSSPWLSDMVNVIRLSKTSFTYADILKATGNFSHNRLIGRGGFGTVYRGILPDGREVAVKKQLREGADGEREFQAEMEVLSGNNFGWPHKNLVTLYGWCLDGAEKILVYEYMEGGSLEDLVLDRVRLTWKRRIDIAMDVAKALVFLHHECYPAIVHRDVKASNVLLDKDGKARVTDFGLARVVCAGNSHVSTMVAGTIGYVAPEYGQTWKATTKGDVYSYGVFILELATGRRAVDGGEECLVEWGRRVIGSRNIRRAMIPVVVLGSGLAEGAEEMCELLRIGVRCTAEAPQGRPDMKEVLAMLFKLTTASRGNFVSHFD